MSQDAQQHRCDSSGYYMEVDTIPINMDIRRSSLPSLPSSTTNVFKKDSELSSRSISTTTTNSRNKSKSCESSPGKGMENCLFTFPIPSHKTWTILVEPNVNQVMSFIERGKELNLIERPKSTMSDRQLPLDESSLSWASSSDSSPRAKRRQRIYLNGKCIDNGISLPSLSSKMTKNKLKSTPKVFTFVADKRMQSSSLAISSTQSSHGDLSSLKRQIFKPANNDIRDTLTKRRGRKPKSFLTFHQLEFDNTTLKPYDRSVFTKSMMTTLSSTSLSDQNRPFGTAKEAVFEAAEILLELQSRPSNVHKSYLVPSQ